MLEISIMNIALTFVAGLASVLSPCVLPVLPIIVSGTEKDSKFRIIFIVLGISLTFMLMGVLTSQFASLIGGNMIIVEKIASVFIFVFGVLMLLDINLFKKFSLFSNLGGRRDGLFGGFILGTTLGLIWIPCVGPMLSSVLALVAADGRVVSGLFLLLIYSMGFAIPMLVAGFGAHYFKSKVGFLKTNPLVVRIISGGLLVFLGAWIFFNGAMVNL